MSGMPAWEFRLTDEELWAVVAFLQRLPRLDAAAVRAATRRRAARRAPRLPCGAAPRAGAGAPPATRERGAQRAVPVRLQRLPHHPRRHRLDPHVGPPLAGMARPR